MSSHPDTEIIHAVQDTLRDASAADPDVLHRMTQVALRQGHTLRLRRRTVAAAAPVAVAAMGAVAMLVPGSTSSIRPTVPPAAVAAQPNSARAVLLIISQRLAAATRPDGPVFWIRTETTGPRFAHSTGDPRRDHVITYSAYAQDGQLKDVTTFPDGYIDTQTYPAGGDRFALGAITGTNAGKSEPTRGRGTDRGIPTLGDKVLTKSQLRALPTDPARLGALIDKGIPAADIAFNRFDAITRLLMSPTTPAVQAAAYRLLAATPGIIDGGVVKDPLGRTGHALDLHGQDWYPGAYTPRLIIRADGTLLAFVNGPTGWQALLGSGYRNTL